MLSVIENGIPWLDWQLEVWLRSIDRNDIAKFTAIESSIRSLVESIHSPVLRQYYIDKASKYLATDSSSAIVIAKEWSQNVSSVKTKKQWLKLTPPQTRLIAEKQLIRMYIHFPDKRKDLFQLMSKIHSPAYRWLWQRIKELDQHSDYHSLKHSIMAILCVCEPYYTRQLRPIIVPTISIKPEPGIINHITSILEQELLISGI
jgi:hypothetical protein